MNGSSEPDRVAPGLLEVVEAAPHIAGPGIDAK
jgi:hypothetical protein